MSFCLEVLGRVVLLGSVIVAFQINWWLPLIVAPFIWQIWDILLGTRSRIGNEIPVIIADIFTYMLCLTYIVYSSVGFGINVGNWYGWVIGIIVGALVGHFMGLLFPHRWHLEASDKFFTRH